MLGVTKLKDVILFDGLKVNLISIIQICDDKCFMKLTHKKCTMFNNFGKVMVKGTKLYGNFYYACSYPSILYNRASLSNEELWHQILDHVNYMVLKKLTVFEYVKGLSNITTKLDHICGLCQFGKQSKSQHRKNQHLTISRPLKL